MNIVLIRSKLDAIEDKQSEGSRCPSMELEYDLTEEFKGNIEKVPEKGSVENLTLKRKKKTTNNDSCEFWEDPLAKVSEVQEVEAGKELLAETREQGATCTMGSGDELEQSESEENASSTSFIPITETNDLTSSNDIVEEELSHSPALDTPLSTFYHLVPDSDSEGQEKAANNIPERQQSDSPKTISSSPPSPTSTEVRSILENYVVDQLLIKNSTQQGFQSHPNTTEEATEAHQNHLNRDETTEGLVPALTPQKTCIAGTAQISATSPKRMKLAGRSREMMSPSRKCLSDAGDNRSDTHSEDSYGSNKTDPLHYVKAPRRGIKPCHASSGSLPREYKVIVRDKMACVHYVGCEMDTDKDIKGQNGTSVQRSPNKTATVQLR